MRRIRPIPIPWNMDIGYNTLAKSIINRVNEEIKRVERRERAKFELYSEIVRNFSKDRAIPFRVFGVEKKKKSSNNIMK